jgi:hypothetical protein
MIFYRLPLAKAILNNFADFTVDCPFLCPIWLILAPVGFKELTKSSQHRLQMADLGRGGTSGNNFASISLNRTGN